MPKLSGGNNLPTKATAEREQSGFDVNQSIHENLDEITQESTEPEEQDDAVKDTAKQSVDERRAARSAERVVKDELRQQVAAELVKHFGDQQLFKYGTHIGTIHDMLNACPAVSAILSRGFQAACEQLEVMKYEEEATEEDADEADTLTSPTEEDTAKDDTKKDTKQQSIDNKVETAQKTTDDKQAAAATVTTAEAAQRADSTSTASAPQEPTRAAHAPNKADTSEVSTDQVSAALDTIEPTATEVTTHEATKSSEAQDAADAQQDTTHAASEATEHIDQPHGTEDRDTTDERLAQKETQIQAEKVAEETYVDTPVIAPTVEDVENSVQPIELKIDSSEAATIIGEVEQEKVVPTPVALVEPSIEIELSTAEDVPIANEDTFDTLAMEMPEDECELESIDERLPPEEMADTVIDDIDTVLITEEHTDVTEVQELVIDGHDAGLDLPMAPEEQAEIEQQPSTQEELVATETLRAWRELGKQELPLDALLTTLVDDAQEPQVYTERDSLELTLVAEHVEKTKVALETLYEAENAEECRERLADVFSELAALLELLGYSSPNEIIREFIRIHGTEKLYDLIGYLYETLQLGAQDDAISSTPSSYSTLLGKMATAMSSHQQQEQWLAA